MYGSYRHCNLWTCGSIHSLKLDFLAVLITQSACYRRQGLLLAVSIIISQTKVAQCIEDIVEPKISAAEEISLDLRK